MTLLQLHEGCADMCDAQRIELRRQLLVHFALQLAELCGAAAATYRYEKPLQVSRLPVVGKAPGNVRWIPWILELCRHLLADGC